MTGGSTQALKPRPRGMPLPPSPVCAGLIPSGPFRPHQTGDGAVAVMGRIPAGAPPPSAAPTARLFGRLRRHARNARARGGGGGGGSAHAPGGRGAGRGGCPLSAGPARRRDDIMRKCRPGAASPAAVRRGAGRGGRAGRKEGRKRRRKPPGAISGGGSPFYPHPPPAPRPGGVRGGAGGGNAR